MLEKSKLKTASPKILSWLILRSCGHNHSGASSAADGRSADQIVDSLQKNYDATVDFVADFRQETEVKTLNRNLKAWGKLTFKRPGKMLWRYEEPKGQFVLGRRKKSLLLSAGTKSSHQKSFEQRFPFRYTPVFLARTRQPQKEISTSRSKAPRKTSMCSIWNPKARLGGFSEVARRSQPEHV